MDRITAWKSLINLIRDGEYVRASTPNRPLTELAQRTEHLKDMLDLLGTSETVYLRGVPVSTNTAVGQPVYLNNTAQQFKPALAAADMNNSNWGTTAESAFVWGIVQRKITANSADLIISGVIRDLDFTAAGFDDDTETGPYYLSGTTAGALVRQRPAVGIYVLYWWKDTGTALLAPNIGRDLLEQHIHYKFELAAVPAGTVNSPSEGETHEILVADDTIQGWLPADYGDYADVAPAGAKFVYNLPEHQALYSLFPPIPISSYYLEIYRNNEGMGRKPDDYIKIDNNGIWWMEDAYGHAPWPVSTSGVGSGDPTSVVPPIHAMDGHGFDASDDDLAIYLWFSKFTFKTGNTTVTSLRPCANSPIKVLECGNCITDATTGDLALDLEWTTSDDADDGALVFKEVEDGVFKRGPVVEKVQSGSPEIDVDSTIAGGSGTVTVSYTGSSSSREVDVSLIGLNNAMNDEYQNIMFINLLSGRDSDIRMRVDVPSTISSTAANLKLKLTLLGSTAGTLPDLTISYRNVPYSATAVALPTTDSVTTETLNGGALSTAYYYKSVITSTAISVSAGDMVFFTISRAGSTDGYAGNVGLLKIKGYISFS